ncbi:hypothetical protein AVEN_80105-1 [Araneus ventricosus]|uniref:Protein kinase domain-containing protein n=1 Tax=Araneus ventricosus TaxID=182803 RepID=A0A4Y2SHL6_ARAVE|nr:hypothetical protein AVEN_80105-1 [Araneus ventricosus]
MHRSVKPTENLQHWVRFNMLEVKFAHELNEAIISLAAWDLLQKGFRYNPKKRFTAEECLAHPYFSEEPLAWGSGVIETICKLTDVRRAKRLIEKQIKCLNAITLM